MDLIITNHARDRYLVRSKKQFIHLFKCILKDCNDCKSMQVELAFYVQNKRRLIDKEIASKVKAASEEKFLLNDMNFMANWHDQHGFDATPSFKVDSELVYVIINENGKHKLVTCIDSKTHVAARKGKFKLNKKKKIAV